MEDQILILSDIHYGDLAQSTRLREQDPSKACKDFEQLSKAISSAITKKGLNPKYLLVPGDLTSEGKPLEFEMSKKFISCVAKELNIGEGMVLITYGNHDVDWSICGLGNTSTLSRQAYCKLAALVGSVFAPYPAPSIPGPVIGSGVYCYNELEFIVLNTGIECYFIDEREPWSRLYHHGRVGKQQLTWLRSLPAKSRQTRIAVIHHHIANIPYPKYASDISLLEEGAEIRAEFGRLGVDVVIHGHRHHPFMHTVMETNWMHPISFICAGSYGVNSSHRSGGCIPNTFHVVQLRESASSGNRAGCLYTFKQISSEAWVPISDSETDVDVDSIQWFGCLPDRNTRESTILGIIQESISSAGNDEYIKLPKFNDLPLDLRCLRSGSLNSTFQKICLSLGYVTTGKFPCTCLISKSI